MKLKVLFENEVPIPDNFRELSNNLLYFDWYYSINNFAAFYIPDIKNPQTCTGALLDIEGWVINNLRDHSEERIKEITHHISEAINSAYMVMDLPTSGVGSRDLLSGANLHDLIIRSKSSDLHDDDQFEGGFYTTIRVSEDKIWTDNDDLTVVLHADVVNILRKCLQFLKAETYKMLIDKKDRWIAAARHHETH